MKRKQILAFMLSLSMIFTVSHTVLGMNADGIGPIVYSYNSGDNTVIATAKVNSLGKALLLCSYDGSGIMTDMAMEKGTGQLSATLAKDAFMRAAVVDENGKALTASAVYGKDNTDLQYIKIDGKKIESFKNSGEDANRYTVKVSGSAPSVEISPKDASTIVSFDFDAVKVPGENVITVTSSGGTVRRIKLNLYNDDDDPSYLLGISYKIDGNEIPLDGFKPYTTDYNIALPDNTMSIKLNLKYFDNAKVTVRVKDDKDPEINSLAGQGSTAYYYERNCVNGFVPIKNGETQVKVVLEYGQYIRIYNLTFRAKQPNLTDFNNVGAENDSNKPVFIGGSAVNNDNGTLLGSDRMWTLTNISKDLLGGSMFLFPTGSNGNDSWWKSNNSGEYFNFTADAAGTVYVLSTNAITNSEYDPDWEKGSSTVSEPSEGWLKCDKTLNDYTPGAIIANSIEYQVGSESDLLTYGHYCRAIYPGVSRISDSEFEDKYKSVLMYPMQLSYYAKRHFEAGEAVSIYHTGSAGAKKATAIIIWDSVSGADMYDEAEGTVKTDIDTETVLDLQYDEAYNQDTAVWKDSSNYGNDVSLVTTGENGWVSEKGYKIGAGETVSLPEIVKDTINTNSFTLRFYLSELNPIANRTTNIIIKSQDGNINICKTRKDMGQGLMPALSFKFGNNELNLPWESGMDSALYTVTFEKNSGSFKGYIGEDMTLKGETDGSTTLESFTADNVLLGGSGSASSQIFATIKSLRVYSTVILPNTFDFMAKTEGERASVILLYPGKTHADVKAALLSGNVAELKAAVMYFNQYEAESGEASVEIPMPIASPAGGVSYNVVIDGVEKSVIYDKNTSAADLSVLWNGDSDSMKAVSGIEYENLDSECRVKALQYANELISGTPTLEEAKDEIDLAVMIASISSGGQIGYDNLKEKAISVGVAPEVTFEDADKLKTSEKEAVMSGIKGKAFASVSGFTAELSKQIFTQIMISEAYTDNEKAAKLSEYAVKLGIRLGNYSKLLSDDKILFIKNNLSGITDFSNIQTKLNAIPAPKQISGGGGGGGGGKVNIVPTVSIGENVDTGNTEVIAKFTDISGHWAKAAIETLSNSNIISGYNDGSFKPQNTVTRAEFITMLSRKYLSDSAYGEKFSDVQESDWYYDFVMRAYKAEIVAGVEGDAFMPDKEISRQDMSVMLFRLAKYLGKTVDTDEAAFTDFDTVSDYAKDGVSFLKKLGVISGDESGAFRPQDNATRAEAAQMIYKFIQIIG